MNYIADRRYYLTSAGQVVEEGDPAAQVLLVAAGQALPLATARKYGLIPDEPAVPDPETKAIPAPAGNKAQARPQATK